MNNITKLVAAIALVAPGVANAANPTCASLPDPIVVAGSSAVGPFIKSMGVVLAAQTSPTTLIYQKQGSCTGVNAVVNDTTPAGTCATGACIKGTATYYDTAGNALSCDLDVNGTHVDVGVSDVYVDTCTGLQPPTGVSQFGAFIQAMVMVVPEASQQSAMTAEEAYFVFGFGQSGMAMPWIDELKLAIRNALSGTQQMVAHEIAVPAGRWKGVDKGNSDGVLAAVSGATAAEPTVGIISSDVYDAHRDTLNALAFQAFHQRGAYYPDSTATSFDKKNVRDGHYTIWGALQMIAHVDGSGVPNTAASKRFIDWVRGNTGTGGTAAPFNILDITIAAHVIPDCAMHVKRSTQGGALSPYTPANDCSAYFDSHLPQ